MIEDPVLDRDFRRFLLGIVDISERQLDKLVAELGFHWAETVEQYVTRRHRELQREGVPNRLVYGLIASELARRPFATPPRTERQVRRMIYG